MTWQSACILLLYPLPVSPVWLGSSTGLVRAEVDPRGELAAHAHAIAGTVGLAQTWKVDTDKNYGALRIKGQTLCLLGSVVGSSVVGMDIACAQTEHNYYLHYAVSQQQLQFCTLAHGLQCTWSQCLQATEAASVTQAMCSQGVPLQQWHLDCVQAGRYFQIQLVGEHRLKGFCLKAAVTLPSALQLRNCTAEDPGWESSWRWPYAPDIQLPWHAGPKCRESHELHGAVKMRGGGQKCMTGPAGVMTGDVELSLDAECSAQQNRFLFQWRQSSNLLQACNQDLGRTCRWDQCIEAAGAEVGAKLLLRKCNPSSAYQHWAVRCWGGFKDIALRWAPTMCLKANIQDYTMALRQCKEAIGDWDAAWTLPYSEGYKPAWCADPSAMQGAWKIKGNTRCLEFTSFDCSASLSKKCSSTNMNHLMRFNPSSCRAELCNADSCGECRWDTCLEAIELSVGSQVSAKGCREGVPLQHWQVQLRNGTIYWEVLPKMNASMCLMAKTAQTSSPLSLEMCTSKEEGIERLWEIPFAGD